MTLVYSYCVYFYLFFHGKFDTLSFCECLYEKIGAINLNEFRRYIKYNTIIKLSKHNK